MCAKTPNAATEQLPLWACTASTLSGMRAPCSTLRPLARCTMPGKQLRNRVQCKRGLTWLSGLLRSFSRISLGAEGRLVLLASRNLKELAQSTFVLVRVHRLDPSKRSFTVNTFGPTLLILPKSARPGYLAAALEGERQRERRHAPSILPATSCLQRLAVMPTSNSATAA